VEGRPLEDYELVERAKQGDVNAYAELVARYQEVAFRVAYHIAGVEADAEEAAQEAFIKAYYALGRFRAGAPWRPWLLRIVANEARNRRSASARRTGLALRAAEARASGDTALSPEVLVEARAQRAELLDAIHQLAESDQLALTYRYFLDLSEEEMAAALDCARGTVKSRLSRALGRLREVMGVVQHG
jgi:RNA polymerase sigma-70 factor (ECF subfamily)